MPSNRSLIGAVLAATVLLTVGALSAATQQQPSRARAGWPCGAPLSASYFQLAEATGGHLVLLAPSEIADSATLLTAFSDHRQTLFRVAGDLKSGIHEFRVPVDPSVDSLVVSISVQCLQTADVIDPSGVSVGGENVTDLSNFSAIRMVIVRRPAAGMWTLRAAGNGIGGVVVQARSAVGITHVEFGVSGSPEFRPLPVLGVENIVRITVSGRPQRLEASLVNAAFRTIAPLPLASGDTDATYVSRFTPGTEGFRIAVSGFGDGGAAIQRVYASLFTPLR
jgi:hypothetical protein